jgi:hypothetical protein
MSQERLRALVKSSRREKKRERRERLENIIEIISRQVTALQKCLKPITSLGKELLEGPVILLDDDPYEEPLCFTKPEDEPKYPDWITVDYWEVEFPVSIVYSKDVFSGKETEARGDPLQHLQRAVGLKVPFPVERISQTISTEEWLNDFLDSSSVLGAIERSEPSVMATATVLRLRQ